MEDQHLNVVSAQPAQNTTKSYKTLLFVVIALLLIIGAAFGTYVWQHSKLTVLNQKVATLQAQLASVSKQTKPTQSTLSTSTHSPVSTFTYKPKLGGLSITLPTTYQVLVGADGNFGGAPGVDFKVVSLGTSNITSDANFTQEAEIQIGGFTSLSNSVSVAEGQMQQNHDCSTLGSGSCNTTDFSVADTTVGGQPAKLITAKAANEYLGNVNVYVGGLGQWGYTIISNDTTQPTNFTPGTLLTAVLSGISLEQANWP